MFIYHKVILIDPEIIWKDTISQDYFYAKAHFYEDVFGNSKWEKKSLPLYN